MSIRQVSLFLENKPGHLGAICKTIADAKVNLLAISIAEASGFGIVRLIAQSPDQAIEALSGASRPARRYSRWHCRGSRHFGSGRRQHRLSLFLWDAFPWRRRIARFPFR